MRLPTSFGLHVYPYFISCLVGGEVVYIEIESALKPLIGISTQAIYIYRMNLHYHLFILLFLSLSLSLSLSLPPAHPRTPYTRHCLVLSSKSDLESRIRRRQLKREQAQGADNTELGTGLRAALGVADGVEHPAQAPQAAQGTSEHGVLEARDEHGADGGGEVFSEVGMGALGFF